MSSDLLRIGQVLTCLQPVEGVGPGYGPPIEGHSGGGIYEGTDALGVYDGEEGYRYWVIFYTAEGEAMREGYESISDLYESWSPTEDVV